MCKRLRLLSGIVLLSTALLVSCTLFFGVTQAHAWGSATHAYIDDRIGKQGPLRNLNEIYGGMAPDVFNYLFDHPDWLEYLYLETHYENNVILWKKANTLLEKAVAFGFVSHNGMTGADATAHGTYNYSAPDGYVIAKTVRMVNSAPVQKLLNGVLSGDPDNVAAATYELCHTFVESAVDLLLARQDRSLGGKISAAALARTREFPDLLVKAYARRFAQQFGLDYATAAKTIRSAENEFRKTSVFYGLALAQEPETARDLIVEQLVALAPAFLASYRVELRLHDGTTLKQLSDDLIGEAIELCEVDYLPAVQETIQFVSGNLEHLKRSR
jgi:hypothetical protein